MDNGAHTLYKAFDRSYSAQIKKDIHSLAIASAFSERRVGEIDIVVAELLSNLIKHAGGGEILVKFYNDDVNDVLELISIDSGPGMADVSRMMTDGVSTKNTLGHGLGAMRRLADIFQVYSIKDWGTIVLTRFFPVLPSTNIKTIIAETRSIILPKPGESACGDAGFHYFSNSHLKYFLADGLGHGKEAAEAASIAGEAFSISIQSDPVIIIREINEAVRRTRGLVGMTVVFDVKQQNWNVCGIGNISSKIINSIEGKNLMSYNGIIGVNLPRTINPQQYSYENGQYLIMCSDGVKTLWDTSKYPFIFRYDLSIIAAAIIKDFWRKTDDVSVMINKINL